MAGNGREWPPWPGLLDIEEAHLSFQRQSNAPRIETGMPTLRRFIRPSDWDRVEGARAARERW